MYLLYNLALWAAMPLWLPWMVYRALRGRLPGLWERLGVFAAKGFEAGASVIWIHAVSVGEVNAAGALIKEIRNRIPKVRIVMTSSTGAGWNAARQLLSQPDLVLFPPCDLAFVCRRFLHHLRPSAVVVLETELWPNFFREAKRSGAALLLANGRISDRTFPRYLASRFFWRRVLDQPDRLFAQSTADAERFKALGARAEKVRVAGNLKFAGQPAPSPFVEALREKFRDSEKADASTPGHVHGTPHGKPGQAGQVIVAGSTMPGEEKYLLEAFLQLSPEFPRLWMVLAPRHPNRFAEVAEQVRELGIPYQLRSEWRPETSPILPGVLILDSMGELGAMYGLATAAFVGGTLAPAGGHNILEPASFARPIVIGPSMSNFQEIADEFLQDAGVGKIPAGERIRVGSIIQAPDESALAPVFRFLFQNPGFSRRLGEAAQARWKKSRSGVAAVLDELQRLLAPSTAPFHPQAAVPEQEAVGISSGGKMK